MSIFLPPSHKPIRCGDPHRRVGIGEQRVQRGGGIATTALCGPTCAGHSPEANRRIAVGQSVAEMRGVTALRDIPGHGEQCVVAIVSRLCLFFGNGA